MVPIDLPHQTHTINKYGGNTLCVNSLTNSFHINRIFIYFTVTLSIVPLYWCASWKTAVLHSQFAATVVILIHMTFHDFLIVFIILAYFITLLRKTCGVIFWNVSSRIFFRSSYWFQTVPAHRLYFRSIRHIWAFANHFFLLDPGALKLHFWP